MAPPNVHGFPQELPPRPEVSWKDRNCPGVRTCWHFNWEAFSFQTSDKEALARRACMWVTLLTRTVIGVAGTIAGTYGKNVGGFIVGAILNVLGFFFIAWCLASIGQAQGKRRVFGTLLGRWHFDVVLFAAGLIHIGLLVGFLTGIGNVASITTWYAMWLLIFAAAWITTWAPEPESYV